MSRKCYAAFTKPGFSYPAYINISTGPAENEMTVTLRGDADKNGACGADVQITLGPNEWRKFVEELKHSIATGGV